MKVNIKIDCETAIELQTHLQAISETVKIRSRGNLEYDFEVGTQFSDNNCYGTHEVTITPNNNFFSNQ